PAQPIAVFFPGLTGCSQADYLKTLVPLAHRLGYRTVAANYRGMGNTKLLTPRFYCGTTDDDIHEAVEHIRRNYPKAKLVAIGTSLGGILLGRYLISSGDKSRGMKPKVFFNVLFREKAFTNHSFLQIVFLSHDM